MGESGCGKSVTARAVMDLIRTPGKVTGGSVQDNADATLDNWIREEARGIRVYETLLRSRLPDPVRKTFRQILNIKHRQLKQPKTANK